MKKVWDDAHTDIVENADIIEGDKLWQSKVITRLYLALCRKQVTYVDGYTFPAKAT
jgi:hypothetical protein